MNEVYDIFTVLNNFWFHIVEFVVILALAVLAVFLGAKLRKVTKSAAKKEQEAVDNAVKAQAEKEE